VFLYADVDFRIKRIKEIYHLSNDDAVKMIEASDRDRKRYLSNITGIDWNDTRQYHLSLDTSVLGFPLVEDIIADCLLARFGISSPELEPFNEGH
jgi:cytidylate kinase